MLLLFFCGQAGGSETAGLDAKGVERIRQMPAMPGPYLMRDWRQVTRGYLDLVLDFERTGEHLPLARWLDGKRAGVWMPSYVGGKEGPEGINYLAAVVSGSLVGLDMRSYRGINWVTLGTNFFSPPDGICLNRLNQSSGGSFWYDVLPNVLLYQIGSRYPNDPGVEGAMRTVAERFYGMCVALGGRADAAGLPDFNHTGFDLRKGKPFDNGKRIEPEGGAGVAWIEYMAWRKFGDPRFLSAADWCIQSLLERPREANPLYEVLLPYAVITAVRLNTEEGRNHDVGKLLRWCFEPLPEPQARAHWGVIVGNWGGADVHGLVGSTTDGGGYAFAMNTFQYAGTLAPLARYEPRYAKDAGRWLLNLANASRLFYGNAHGAEHQSSSRWASRYDARSVIAYEGLRRWKRGADGVAVADIATERGRVLRGTCDSTHLFEEQPNDAQVLEETAAEGCAALSHTWKCRLPMAEERFLVVAADRVDGGHVGNFFRFSYATRAEGPYAAAFCVTNKQARVAVELPPGPQGDLFLKVESGDSTPGRLRGDQLWVDAISISYRAEVTPFAQGDHVVAFVDLIKNYTVPIVLYRPETAVTDLGLYGSSHVGMLGGIVESTSVEGVLRWDLLNTDFFHGPASPTYLYYNPHTGERRVELAVGSEPKRIIDLASGETLFRRATGTVKLPMGPDSARVIAIENAGAAAGRSAHRFPPAGTSSRTP